jgi:hypothetical protein
MPQQEFSSLCPEIRARARLIFVVYVLLVAFVLCFPCNFYDSPLFFTSQIAGFL